jgi:hypothetical protein
MEINVSIEILGILVEKMPNPIGQTGNFDSTEN